VSAPNSTRVGTPITVTADELANVRYDEKGLVVAIVQESSTRDILMVGYMDAEALRRTLATGRTCFYSRSRQEYWVKGETSGNRQWVHSVAYDCDGDALLITVDQDGKGACHTGEHTCFFRAFGTP